ncbi:MAG TPA: HEAT repeat domain-containing protein [Candidatus Acidoferrales bacterium]|nr:HEAT repeat domain-containing protein [Candidatus Acidoferrales bacterium]
MSRLRVASLLLLVPLVPQLVWGEDASAAQVQQWVAGRNVAAIRALGRPVLPKLVHLYESASDDGFKARVAQTFYELGWESPEAKRALMKDVHTQNQDLRLQVQWALGRVSNDQDVVDTLIANMRSDSNPLFRDKAACALAYDQIHLSEQQKVRLFGALIEALRDEKLDVRRIALTALQIQTGQTKGFEPGASWADREQKIRVWQSWLAQYKAGL